MALLRRNIYLRLGVLHVGASEHNLAVSPRARGGS